MVDRQDIDALLIGSLYGELSSSEEARLQLHLESHPADRTVLDDLARARHAVQESRILQVQLEPPHSVSALLLQEAARRAPRKVQAREEGWFQRFVRSFVAHPAMAAAAMLVLVVGVAGTMYLRQGPEHLSVGTVHQEDVAAPEAAGQAPSAPAAEPMAVAGNDAGVAAMEPDDFDGQAQTGSGFNVRLADAEGRDKNAEKAKLAKQAQELRKEQQKLGEDRSSFAQPVTPKPAKKSPDAKPVTKSEPVTEAKVEAAPAAKANPVRSKKDVLRRTGPSNALEVGTPQRVPMDLDEDSLKEGDKSADRVAPRGDTVPGGGVAGGFSPPADPKPAPTTPQPAEPAKGRGFGGAAPPPPPPPPSSTLAARDAKADKADAKDTRETKDKRPSQVTAPAPATADDARQRDTVSPELAWAQDAHARVRTQVRAGNCADAAKLALTLSTRAPAYYEANVLNDRQVRDCLAYINAELDREAERDRAVRAKAAPKRATDEPAKAKPAAPSKK